MDKIDNQNFKNRPIVIQVDSWEAGEMGDEPKRHKIIITDPIASSFKVTNGKYVAIVTIDELGIEVKAFDKEGNEEKFITRKLVI